MPYYRIQIIVYLFYISYFFFMHYIGNNMVGDEVVSHSNLKYLLVSINEQFQNQIQSQYQVFTYTQDMVTLQEITDSVLKSKNMNDFNHFSIKDENNITLQSKTTIKKLRILTGYDNLNGFKIKIILGNTEIEKTSMSWEQFYPYNINYQLCFNIVNSSSKIYQTFDLQRHLKIEHLAKYVLSHLNEQFKYNLELSDIKLKKPISYKQMEIGLNNQMQVFEHINNDDIINAYINQSKMPKVSPVNQKIDFQLLIFMGDNKLPLKIPYNQLKQLKIISIFKELGIQHYEQFGLQAFNKFYYPFDYLSSLKHDLDSYPAKDKVILLRAIKQKIQFNQFLKQKHLISEPFNLKELKLTAKGQQIYQKCQKKALEISKKHQHFNQHLLILCFLKNIEYVEINQRKNLKTSINQFLRTQKFLLQKKQNRNKIWQYRFIHKLVDAIIIVCKYYENYSYINFSYEVSDKIDQLIDFKQFLIGSLQKKENKNCYMINNAKGYQFPKYLQLTQDEEIIYLPYIQFKISQIQGNKLKTIYLNQFEGGTPSCNLSIILWIDDKLTEGPIIFKNVHHRQSSVLYQLKSNKQLNQWLKNHENLLNKQNIRISVITNMRRIEEGVEHKDAGIKTIQQIRRRVCDVFIFMYIGHIEGTISHLAKNNIIMDKINIGNSSKQVEKFIYQLGKYFPVNVEKKSLIMVQEDICSMM